jgi:hypothetical protein
MNTVLSDECSLNMHIKFIVVLRIQKLYGILQTTRIFVTFVHLFRNLWRNKFETSHKHLKP